LHTNLLNIDNKQTFASACTDSFQHNCSPLHQQALVTVFTLWQAMRDSLTLSLASVTAAAAAAACKGTVSGSRARWYLYTCSAAAIAWSDASPPLEAFDTVHPGHLNNHMGHCSASTAA
jgi:hypothetical protein